MALDPKKVYRRPDIAAELGITEAAVDNLWAKYDDFAQGTVHNDRLRYGIDSTGRFSTAGDIQDYLNRTQGGAAGS